MRRNVAILLIGLLLPSFGHAAAPVITAARIGFGDQYKVGYWMPVAITLKGGDERLEGKLEVTVPDGDGVPTRITAPAGQSVVAAPGSETTVPLFVKIGQSQAELTATFVVNDSMIAEQTFRPRDGSLPAGLDADRPLVLAVGKPLGIQPTSTAVDSAATARTVFTILESPADFPTEWFGYESVDALILCTAELPIYAQLSDNQLTAIDRWVQLGGRLVLCVGSQAEQVLASDAPLSRFAPGKYVEQVSLNQTSAWESYVETTDPLDSDSQGNFRMEVPRLENVRGRIDAFDGARATDLPLVIRTPHGFGEIVFVAADLDRPPFSQWAARGAMLDKLLETPTRRDAEEQATSKGASAFGYSDLAGQLRSALEQYPQVRLLPFSLVASLVALYIVAIGPLDYFLVKRLLRRPEWTWFTFPAIVLLFGASAVVLAFAYKGDQLRVNQVDIVDFDAESKLVRGTAWSNLFSPRVDAYDLAFQPKVAAGTLLREAQVLTSWMGLPGDGFGGMSAAAGSVPLFSESYDYSPSLDALTRVPVGVWSTKGLAGRWTAQADPPVLAELVDQGDKLLAGSIASQLDEPLTDCVLVYDRWAYPIGKLDPHARFSVENKLDPQTVDTYFKHVSILHEKDSHAAYDPANLDLPRIIETIMFHRQLGGDDYTRLSNQYQKSLDVSQLVNIGRAVLLGRGPVAGTMLVRDGKPLSEDGGQQWTFIRIVFPVVTKSAR